MLKKRDDFDEGKYFIKLEEIIKKQEENEFKVREVEYENWLVDYLNKHNEFSDWADQYLYQKPEGIRDEDIDNIFLLKDFWEYKNPKPEKMKHHADFTLDELLTIDSDEEIQIELQGNKYYFSQTAGQGCYEYFIKLIPK